MRRATRPSASVFLIQILRKHPSQDILRLFLSIRHSHLSFAISINAAEDFFFSHSAMVSSDSLVRRDKLWYDISQFPQSLIGQILINHTDNYYKVTVLDQFIVAESSTLLADLHITGLKIYKARKK